MRARFGFHTHLLHQIHGNLFILAGKLVVPFFVISRNGRFAVQSNINPFVRQRDGELSAVNSPFSDFLAVNEKRAFAALAGPAGVVIELVAGRRFTCGYGLYCSDLICL